MTDCRWETGIDNFKGRYFGLFGFLAGDAGGVLGDGYFVTVVVGVEVEDLALVVKAVLRLVWGLCEWEDVFIFRRLSLMLVEGKMSNVGGRLFGMVMWADFSRLLSILDSCRLGKITGAKVEMEEVVEMVVVVVARVFDPFLGCCWRSWLCSCSGSQWCGDDCGRWWCR